MDGQNFLMGGKYIRDRQAPYLSLSILFDALLGPYLRTDSLDLFEIIDKEAGWIHRNTPLSCRFFSYFCRWLSRKVRRRVRSFSKLETNGRLPVSSIVVDSWLLGIFL